MYAKKVRSEMAASIKAKIQRGERYSVTTDEYTSTQNKRYSAVSLHPSVGTGRPMKIGMMRIYGSLPAEKAASDLEKKLLEYGVHEEHHVVGNTTDGCNAMKKGISIQSTFLIFTLKYINWTFISVKESNFLGGGKV